MGRQIFSTHCLGTACQSIQCLTGAWYYRKLLPTQCWAHADPPKRCVFELSHAKLCGELQIYLSVLICEVSRGTSDWWCPADRGGKRENDLSSLGGSAAFKFPHQQNDFHRFFSCIICLKSTRALFIHPTPPECPLHINCSRDGALPSIFIQFFVFQQFYSFKRSNIHKASENLHYKKPEIYL